MLKFKDYLTNISESNEVPGHQVSDKELVTLLGKSKTNSLLSNPFSEITVATKKHISMVSTR